jgi:hypothetical protein
MVTRTAKRLGKYAHYRETVVLPMRATFMFTVAGYAANQQRVAFWRCEPVGSPLTCPWGHQLRSPRPKGRPEEKARLTVTWAYAIKRLPAAQHVLSSRRISCHESLTDRHRMV